MRKQGLVAGKAIVIKARVPIIKCHLSLGVAADISLGAVNGAAAVEWVQRQGMRGVGRGFGGIENWGSSGGGGGTQGVRAPTTSPPF